MRDAIVFAAVMLWLLSMRKRPVQFKCAEGKRLTLIGDSFGVARRWWGIEPDFLFRPRLLSQMRIVPGYRGNASNHLTARLRRGAARLRRWLRVWDHVAVHFSLALSFGALIYLSVR